jgi:hypothetical protein
MMSTGSFLLEKEEGNGPEEKRKMRENTREKKKGEIGMKLLSEVVDQSNVSNKAVAA